MGGMSGETMAGETYDIEVTRGVTFRAYDIPAFEFVEVSVEDGVITFGLSGLPDELTQWQARALAAMLMEAADELERPGVEE
jgi:hypothetical protein